MAKKKKQQASADQQPAEKPKAQTRPSRLDGANKRRKIWFNSSKRLMTAREQANVVGPNLIAVRTCHYNLSKKALSRLNPSTKSRLVIYHVWLDCLYDDDVEYSTIIEDLRVVLSAQQISRLEPSRIFITGYRYDSGYIKPSGSCFIVLESVTPFPDFEDQVEDAIMNCGIHMYNFDLPALREQLTQRPTLIFSQAFAGEISTLKREFLWIPRQLSIERMKENSIPGTANLSSCIEPSASNASEYIIPSRSASTKPRVLQDMNPKVTDTQQERLKPVEKSKRIAATLNGNKNKTDVPRTSASSDIELFEEMLSKKMKNIVLKQESVGDLLPGLREFGSTIIKIENVPANLGINALKLMFGLCSLERGQIVAIDSPNKKRETMTLMMVAQPNSPELKHLLAKSGLTTANEKKITVGVVPMKYLEKHLSTNRDRVRFLADDDKLTKRVAAVGYGTVAWTTRVF